MVPMKPHITQRTLVSFISGQVQSKPFKQAWRLLRNSVMRNLRKPLYQLRRESGELVYNKLHLSNDSPSAAEECQPEETDVTTKPQGILHSSYYSNQ